ncbi:MAG TPA: aminotransferase class V-fold PLP-dependent enzyme [Mariprofundaceae bacterium]|nr:aminotransferase class V-fold PLP-dependent enzyme [Mariprofundaceae bacterium]
MSTEFPLDPETLYLNHAAVAPWPRRTAEAVKAFAEENCTRGAADYLAWLKTEQRLRHRLKRLVNAESVDDIALVKNTSEGLSLVAYGLEWQAGDNVVSTNQEFPSNRIVWESLQNRGIELRCADLSGDDPEGAIIAEMDERTRLLSVSSVQYATGLRMDLERLGKACRDRGVLFCVDAIQSLGALRFDAAACHADFVTADAHKWMLGPEGIALFYSRPEARKKLNLHQYGWHMVEHAGDFDRIDWTEATSARRFEPGSPNMLGAFAMDASLSLLEETGMERIESELLNRTSWLAEAILSESALELVTPQGSDRRAGIITFRFRERDSEFHAQIYRQLMREGIICAHRGGGIRYSPHFYTDRQVIDTALHRALALASHIDGR